MSYIPAIPTELTSLEDVRRYLERELRIIALAIEETEVMQFRVMYAEPKKIADGMVVYADGAVWNPGGGRGLYARVSGLWQKL